MPNPRRVDESSLRKSGTSGRGVGDGMGVMVRVGRGVTGVGESVAVRVGGRSVLVNVGVMVGVGASRMINFCPGNRIGLAPLRLFSLTNSSRSTPYASTSIHRVWPYWTSWMIEPSASGVEGVTGTISCTTGVPLDCACAVVGQPANPAKKISPKRIR